MTLCITTASPSEIELAPAPFPREWVLEGNPEARARQIASSADAAMRVVVWSCTEGRFRWHYSIDETVQVISGEVIVTDHNGEAHRLGPGDAAFFPAGTTSVWHVTKAMRKVAVCRARMPRPVAFGLRAWNWVARRTRAWIASETADLAGDVLAPLPGDARSLV